MYNESDGVTMKIGTAEIQALAAFDTPTIANALEALEVPEIRWLGFPIRSLTRTPKPIVGVAVTATMSEQRGAKYEHLDGWLSFCAEIERTSIPVVAVLHDASQHPGREAMIGEGMSRIMRAAGAVGVICDGCVRDIDALREMAFPVIGKGLTAHRGRIRFHRFQIPIRIDEMAVNPGDLIHADENGAVTIPIDLVASTVNTARDVVTKESKLFAMISEPTYDVAKLRSWSLGAVKSSGEEQR